MKAEIQALEDNKTWELVALPAGKTPIGCRWVYKIWCSEETKKQLHQSFKLKDLAELKYFLGIELFRSHKGIMMNQRKYSLELISEIGLSTAKPSSTPLDCNQKLTTTELDEVAGSGNEPLEDKGQYRRLIGKLLYLTLTGLDIAFAVQTLSQFMQNLKRSHWEASIKAVKYVKREPGLGIMISSNKKNTLTAFVMPIRHLVPNRRKSITDFIVKHGDSLVA
ncbi:PREDICTED: uncharacterized protein LOC109238789 [Nicotiana attenuata]|uniref:uncharacterized protein LOC109238789 n=1 Tax=Nicotiana attenuata TaxID=49451 RepID=UPI000904E4A4|nr:PREDICTED: uncharacterized protein LOC109238789 [Nicotiana attenuata]